LSQQTQVLAAQNPWMTTAKDSVGIYDGVALSFGCHDYQKVFPPQKENSC
jgi:hypothetical protein